MTKATFDELRDRRLRYVESARANDFEDGLRTLLADLYPDNAHFIYELLQNAEDARATTVRFELEPTRLVVTHDGTRPFELGDVEAITSIGKSTKRDDATQIGKFGVGFKAVFAYTSSPEIHSERHSFVIRDLFVPDPLETKAAPGRTIFVFPFDRPEKPASLAFEEVARGLTELAGTSVLFLSNVSTIEYDIAGATSGSISREEATDLEISISEVTDGIRTESKWVRLVGRPDIEGVAHRTVAAAFLLGSEEPKSSKEGKSPQRARIGPLEHGDTCIFFPAAKEKSGLRFHIHAPFASTVARDSVRDTPENDALAAAIGSLVAGALTQLRDLGLLDDGLLAALPNPEDALEARYSKIRDLIREAFERDSVTPVIGGGHSPAADLVRSPSPFRGALDEADLATLTSLLGHAYPKGPRWIPERDGRAGRFLAGLHAHEFGWSELDDVFGAIDVDRLDDGRSLDAWIAWLTEKSDKQLRDLFELLGQGFDDGEFARGWNIHAFAGPIVRVNDDDDGIRLDAAKGAFLPSSLDDTADGRVLAALAYFDDDAQTKAKSRIAAFYQGVGIRRWDEQAAVGQRLEAYRIGSRPTSDARHFADLRAFVAYLKRTRDTALFADVLFVRGEFPAERFRYSRPRSIYLDQPYRETGLAALYGGGRSRLALWAGYQGKVAGIEEFVLALGARAGLEITKAGVISNPELQGKPWWRGKSSHLGIDRDWQIAELAKILESGDSRLLRRLWELCCEASEHYRNAIYQRNSQASRYVVRSQLAIKLEETPWVLDRTGELRLLESMTVEELPDGWLEPPPKSLALALGFGAEALTRNREAQERARKAEEAGVPVELVDLWADLPPEKQSDLLLRLSRERHESSAAQSFPSSAPADPARRSAIVGTDAVLAPEHETEKRERSVVRGKTQVTEASRQYLGVEYTAEDGTMFCQACHDPLPFKLDGRWYFEAVQFMRKRSRMHYQNALALCPLCAALYAHTLETVDESLLAILSEQVVHAESGRVVLPVVLNAKRVEIWFTGKHALDLWAALSAAGEARS